MKTEKMQILILTKDKKFILKIMETENYIR